MHVVTDHWNETAPPAWPPLRPRRTPRFPLRERMIWLALAAIVASGLYMRLDNLSNVQNWAGDAGRDYLVVMEWAKEGKWPLLGPGRITGDFGLGPGWFYTIAPAIVLSGYSIAAGAATIGVLGIAGIVLAFFWIRRSSGSALAALALASVFGWSLAWVESQRECWNPHPLFFALMATLVLMQQARRRPLPCLALYSMLMMILPQWHTTGLSIVLISPLFFGWNLWRGRSRLRRASRKAWIGWGAAVVAVFLLLYLPPVINEFIGLKGNAGSFFRKLLPAASGKLKASWGSRWADATFKLSRDTTIRNFSKIADHGGNWHFWPSALMALTAAAGIAWRKISQPRFRGAPEIGFLAAMAAGFWFVATAIGKSYQPYFAEDFFPVPVLLAAWGAGAMMRRPRLRRRWGGFAALLGLAAAAMLFWQGAVQFPSSWRIHDGQIWHGKTCQTTVRICKDLLKTAGKRTYSLKLVEDASDTNSAHYHALLWLGGNRPANRKAYGDTVDVRQMGRFLLLVTRDKAAHVPVDAGALIDFLKPPVADEDALIYRIDAANVPPGTKQLRFILSEDALKIVPER